jgi:hypothetical protein
MQQLSGGLDCSEIIVVNGRTLDKITLVGHN